ncbi:sn-glycerol 3-phosphate transport system ATP-binding protein [Desulfobaculum xiamenense]|uniref:sn-glycerol 3-phosphate transport system ATP-binding protein n=1 Tax=Desulfobaculum xiamenense TaxID=995050 RepID=A0A846QR55_9BACT|nr:ABC transporter ATP-binding protein [Desulfobaculum xiamenense]NJB67139.1 sn-glycerol 3-phosphate transport system ATP-binding protein [Desulfobaculum xiamenense]
MQITLENISRHWNSIKAVDNVSFSAESGQLLVILGPSGCGKSTMLRLIAGLEDVTGGTIRIGETDVTSLPPSKRRISMVFQSYALFPHLTVAENIVFGLKVRNRPKDVRDQRLKEAAEILGLTPYLDRKPSELSGGQQQRVALGRAIVSKKPVCLMDEPLSNLDAKLRNEMRREIRALQQRLGITMVYVTHDQVEAMTMADKVVLMKDGHKEQHATPEELYRRPATVFAAQFIGTPPMNILPLTGGVGAVRVRGVDTPIPGIPATCAGEGNLLGIRPENIRLAASGIPAQVTGVEYLGADHILSCRVGESDALVRLSGEVAPAMGDAVHLDFSPSDIHLFDAATGMRREG